MSEIVEPKPVAGWNLDHLFRRGTEMILDQHVRRARSLALESVGREDEVLDLRRMPSSPGKLLVFGLRVDGGTDSPGLATN